MAGEVAKIQTTAVVMVPIAAASAPANSLYSDQGQAGAFTNKTPGGSPVQVTSSANDLVIKLKQNLSGETIPQGRPVALMADGSIAIADSDVPGVSEFIGVALEEIAHNAQGRVLLIGPNVPGALTGLGFAPKDPIFLSETRTYVNSLSSFSGGNDRYIRLGFADCPPGAASSTATDLILAYQLISDAP